MHQTKFPWLESEIERAFKSVYRGLAVPSMRSTQFAGIPIFRSNARIYNCAFAPLTCWKDFADLFWLLLNGVGAGYSVKWRHIDQLPKVSAGYQSTFIVPDTKEGWADAVLFTLENPQLEADTSQVRPRGAPLSTGGVASGPEPLLQALANIKKILRQADGRQLRPIEAFDIMCYLADVVVVGAVRRAATIAQFDFYDTEMLQAKSGKWYISDPQRARANISAALERDLVSDSPEMIGEVLNYTFKSGAGEPGILLTGHPDWGFNPCAEIFLRPRGFCNLTEINIAACETPDDFLCAAWDAAVIGTLQASYIDFEYLHPDWRKNAEEEALLGVSMTGQAMRWNMLTDSLLREGAQTVLEANTEWARMLDINPAARTTTVKPSGNTSAWLGSITSGIHAAHSDYFLRRVRVDRKDDLGRHLIQTFGEESPESDSFIEADKHNPENIVVTIPVQMSEAIKREEETALSLLERAKHIYTNWVLPGHIKGAGTHNVSLTVNFKPEEQEDITTWMIENRDYWSGISLLPYDGGTYVQAPFEEITREEYYQWLDKLPQDIELDIVYKDGYVDSRVQELACSGVNGCEVT